VKIWTDTEKWDDSWWMSLSMEERALFGYLCDKCDHGGIWKQDRMTVQKTLGFDEKAYGRLMQALCKPYEGSTKVLVREYQGSLVRTAHIWIVNYVKFQHSVTGLILGPKGLKTYAGKAFKTLAASVELFPEILEIYDIPKEAFDSLSGASGRLYQGPKSKSKSKRENKNRSMASQEGECEREIPDGVDDADFQKVISSPNLKIRYEDWLALKKVHPHADYPGIAEKVSRELANSLEPIKRPYGWLLKWAANSEGDILKANPLYDGQGGLRKEMPWTGKPYMDFRRLLVENLFDDRAMLYARMVNEGGKHRYGDPRFDEWCDTDSYIAVVGQYEYSGSDLYDHCLEVMRKDPDGDPLGKVEMAISEGKVFWEVNPNFDMAMIDNESCSLMDMRRSSVGALPIKKVDFGWRAPAGDWRDKAEGGEDEPST